MKDEWVVTLVVTNNLWSETVSNWVTFHAPWYYVSCPLILRFFPLDITFCSRCAQKEIVHPSQSRPPVSRRNHLSRPAAGWGFSPRVPKARPASECSGWSFPALRQCSGWSFQALSPTRFLCQMCHVSHRFLFLLTQISFFPFIPLSIALLSEKVTQKA